MIKTIRKAKKKSIDPIRNNNRIVTNIIKLKDLNAQKLSKKIKEKYFKDKKFIDITDVVRDYISDYDLELIEHIYEYTNYDPISWLDENNLLKSYIVKECSIVIAKYCSHLLDKYYESYTWKSWTTASYCPKLIEKFPNKYNWNLFSSCIAIQCPYLIHKFKDKYNWEDASWAVIYYNPWLVDKFSDYINWSDVIYDYISLNLKNNLLSVYAPMLKKYMFKIDWSAVFMKLRNRGIDINIFDIIRNNFTTEEVTNVLKLSEFNTFTETEVMEKLKNDYFKGSDYIDITKTDIIETFDEKSLSWVYDYSSYNPLLWLDINGLIKPKHFEKFSSIFISNPKCRPILHKYFGKIIEKRKISYQIACENATKLFKTYVK